VTKPVLMVLGSPHLDNPGRDYVNLLVDDVLVPKRQEEIAELAKRLARFRPTKIAVEVPCEEEPQLNEAYRRYVHGQLDLSRGEVHQIGFRLARTLRHAKVYAVDSFADSTSNPDTDFVPFASEHGQDHLVAEALQTGQERVAHEEQILARGSLSDLYVALNNTDDLLADHRVYFTLARIGAGDRYPGADWVQEWYGRNLRIWVNLARLTAPDDRILVLFGAGHAWLLRQFARESGLYELEDPLPYLEPGPGDPKATGKCRGPRALP